LKPIIRMSDILKKAKEKQKIAKEKKKEEPLPEPVQQERPPEPVKERPAAEIKIDEIKRFETEEQKKEKLEKIEFKISPAIMKRTKAASNEENLQLYEETLSLIREILKMEIDYELIDIGRIITQIERIVEQSSLSNKNMSMLAFIKDSKNENYLLCHSVNVCIYSIEMGLGLGYEKSKLVELGVSAILHDIGMVKYLHLSNHPRKLKTREYKKIKNHPKDGAEILKRIDKNLPEIAIRTAYQHHERINGTGYPKGLKEESISEYARIVGLTDVYEALSHPRPYRNEFLPSEVIQQIVANKNAFGYDLIKILLERIGVFPIGCLVELSTREIAQVIKLDCKIPLRPSVRIIYEADGKEPKEIKKLDLIDHSTVHIRKELKKGQLKIPLHYI